MTALRVAAGVLTPIDDRADLGPGRRSRDRDALAGGEPVDVLVVGGGVTGAGIALDAASRGLSVALVEKHDLAFGTSRWSSKLVHGGLRYLAHGDVAVAWESAVERAHLMRVIAPHLVHPLAQLLPELRSTRHRDTTLARMGFAAGDAFALAARTGGGLPRRRRVTADQAARLVPALDRDRLTGGMVSFDGQLEDDARLVVAIARTAAAHGARILTRVAALEVGTGGALVCDDLEPGEFRIRARHTVNATGVWAESLDPSVRLRPSRGTHVILRGETLGSPRAAVVVPVPGEFGRYVFALPQPDGLLYCGLTDVPEESRPLPDEPVPSSAEIAWILEVLSTVLDGPVTPADSIGAFAGLRPLVAPDDDGSARSADISRRHLVRAGSDGLLTVTGGKLTTYRRMAQDVVDRITSVPCRTRSVALVGAGAPTGTVAPRLQRRFGAEAPRVAALADGHPDLLEPLAPGVPMLGVEVVHAVLREGAVDLDDILARRTRVALVADDLASATPRAAEILAGIAR